METNGEAGFAVWSLREGEILKRVAGGVREEEVIPQLVLAELVFTGVVLFSTQIVIDEGMGVDRFILPEVPISRTSENVSGAFEVFCL